MMRYPTRAVNVTLPVDLVDEGKAAVERGEARSFSAWLSARAAGHQPGTEIQHIIDDIEISSSHLHPAERKRIDAEIRSQLDAAYAAWDARHAADTTEAAMAQRAA